jgi:hypothetical protein
MGGGRTADGVGGACALAELTAINAVNAKARAIIQNSTSGSLPRVTKGSPARPIDPTKQAETDRVERD